MIIASMKSEEELELVLLSFAVPPRAERTGTDATSVQCRQRLNHPARGRGGPPDAPPVHRQSAIFQPSKAISDPSTAAFRDAAFERLGTPPQVTQHLVDAGDCFRERGDGLPAAPADQSRNCLRRPTRRTRIPPIHCSPPRWAARLSFPSPRDRTTPTCPSRRCPNRTRAVVRSPARWFPEWSANRPVAALVHDRRSVSVIADPPRRPPPWFDRGDGPQTLTEGGRPSPRRSPTGTCRQDARDRSTGAAEAAPSHATWSIPRRTVLHARRSPAPPRTPRSPLPVPRCPTASSRSLPPRVKTLLPIPDPA